MFFTIYHAIIRRKNGFAVEGGYQMKTDASVNTTNEQTENQENDFIDLVVATAVSTIGLMGIFVVMTVVDLFI